MNHELIHLVERAGVEQKIDALTRGQLALLVLLSDALGSCATVSGAGDLRVPPPRSAASLAVWMRSSTVCEQ